MYCHSKLTLMRRKIVSSEYRTRASIHSCMSTETISISLQIINISRFLYFLTEDTILVQFQEKVENGGFQKNTETEGTPSHSGRKSHFILKITHQIFQVK